MLYQHTARSTQTLCILSRMSTKCKIYMTTTCTITSAAHPIKSSFIHRLTPMKMSKPSDESSQSSWLLNKTIISNTALLIHSNSKPLSHATRTRGSKLCKRIEIILINYKRVSIRQPLEVVNQSEVKVRSVQQMLHESNLYWVTMCIQGKIFLRKVGMLCTSNIHKRVISVKICERTMQRLILIGIK